MAEHITGEGNGTPLQYSCLEKSHGWRSLVGYSPWGRTESHTTKRLHFHFSLSCTREGNVNPLQCTCLENPRDGGASWAAVYGIAQSQTRLKRLSSSSSSSKALMDFFHSSVGKESCCNAGDLSSIPGLGRSPGEGNSYPLQYSGLENSLVCIAQGVAKSWTQLNEFHFQGPHD